MWRLFPFGRFAGRAVVSAGLYGCAFTLRLGRGEDAHVTGRSIDLTVHKTNRAGVPDPARILCSAACSALSTGSIASRPQPCKEKAVLQIRATVLQIIQQVSINPVGIAAPKHHRSAALKRTIGLSHGHRLHEPRKGLILFQRGQRVDNTPHNRPRATA